MGLSPQIAISVAIDGPAGAGKSTTARMVAKLLQIVYVDSGAMYRAVAWKCLKGSVSADAVEAVSQIARDIQIRFIPAENPDDVQRIEVDGTDVTNEIRTPTISQLASTVSTIPAVRESLVAKQRALGQAGGVVMEGRDIGTVVLPEAEVKIFLTASLDERAKRRHLEMQQRGATDVDFETVRADMAERDRRDTTRAVSPLKAADDALLIESDGMTADQVVARILEIARSKAAA
jgi:cytidylate kinase